MKKAVQSSMRLGAKGVKVENPSELGEALKKAMNYNNNG